MVMSTPYDQAMTPPAAPQVPVGPQPPKWYKTPPRPKLADVLASAEEERSSHEDRVQQGFRMLRRISPDPAMAGVFSRLTKKVATGEVERVQLPGLRDETDAAVAFAAQMDWVPQALYRQSLDRDDAAAKEDLCAYLQECAQRQYSRTGGGDLKAAKAFNLWVFGCVAEFTGIDVDDEECGLRMRLVDPQTVFPVWEGERGLAQVYLKYQTTASEFIGTFGSVEGFDEAAVRATAKANADRYDPHYLGEVVEYWDRNWAMICWDDQEVAVLEHGYAEVPFSITPGNFGMPVNIATPHLVRLAGGEYWTADRADDLTRLYQPFLERRVAIHELKEASMGVLATKWRRSLNPARTVKASALTFEDEQPAFSDDEGHVNVIRAEDDAEVEETSVAIDPQVGSAMFAMFQQADATSTPSSLIAGQAPMSQGSGTALNVLARSGYERWALFIRTLEQHETMATEQRLRFLRDYGNVLGMDGVLYIPRRGRPNVRTGQSPAHEVTSDLLRKTGIRVEVRFRRFNPSELPSLAQGVGMMRSLNLMTRRTGIEIVGFTPDPDREMEEMDREMLREVPEIAQAEMMDTLIEDLQEAGWRGSDDDVEALAYKLLYVASRLDIERTNREGEQAQAHAMAQSAQMASLMPQVNGQTGNMNLPVGTQGGRTPGLPAPEGPPAIAGPTPPMGY